MVDVAKQAGVSVGNLYRRFRDKKALLHLVDEHFIGDCLTAFDDRMSDDRMQGKSLEGVARAYIQLMVQKFRQHRNSIIAVMRHADPRDAPTFAKRTQAFNDHVHGRFRHLLLQREAEITHPTPELALNLAIFIASAAARDAVWHDRLRTYPVRVSDRELVDEITLNFVRYLCG
jgi:AcrR family transcriptional regulator